jgi:P-type Cu2+ transporter
MSHQDHGAHGAHGEMFKQRFWISLLLSIPVLIFSTTIQGWLNFTPPAFTGDESVAPLFGTAIFLYGGPVFLQGAGRSFAPNSPA